MNTHAVIAIALGLLFVAAGIYIYFDYSRFAATAREASGVVIDLVEVSRGQSRKAIHPVIRFKTAAGEEIVFTNRVHYSAAIGATLPVSYDPADPNQARIGTPSGVRGWGLIWLILGVVFGGLVCLMGLGIQFDLFPGRRHR